MSDTGIQSSRYADIIDSLILLISATTFLYWFTGRGLFYSENAPVLSAFTSLSLGIMVITRLASRHSITFTKPMGMALLGLVACGNFSSILILFLVPKLFLTTIPGIVPTSIMTSAGLILFCLYEILVLLRKTPDKALIVDDVLLHLALFPGGLSLLGYLLDVDAYISSSLDPRVGIAPIEMLLMALFTLTAVLTNPHLFLWRFLKESRSNKIIFTILFANQYVAAFLVGAVFRSPKLSTQSLGLEFYVMLAGVLTTLVFLSYQSLTRQKIIS